MRVPLNNPDHVPHKRSTMNDKYPNIREHITRYMKDKTGTVYLGDIMGYLSQYYGFKFNSARSIRFDGDMSVRQCIHHVLREIGWQRLGTKKQVNSPGFVKVE